MWSKGVLVLLQGTVRAVLVVAGVLLRCFAMEAEVECVAQQHNHGYVTGSVLIGARLSVSIGQHGQQAHNRVAHAQPARCVQQCNSSYQL